MKRLLATRKGKLGLAGAGVALLVVAAWLLVVGPQRSRATELTGEVTKLENELTTRRTELARPDAGLTVRASDLFRLSKAMPDDPDMAGVLLDVNRLAARNSVRFLGVTPGTSIASTGFTVQPIDLMLQGRYGNLSRFLKDVRSLVTIRKGALDARGRLYSVDQVDFGSPDGEVVFPVVKMTVKLNAFTHGGGVPAEEASAPETDPSASTDGGTVAAGATP